MHVPTLQRSVDLTAERFIGAFRDVGQPLLIHADSMRHLGFRTRARTLAQLRQLFPHPAVAASMRSAPTPSSTSWRPAANAATLARALHDISAAQAHNRSLAIRRGSHTVPRNVAFDPGGSLQRLNLSAPPLLGAEHVAPPHLWLGTSAVHTELHHDCCDNFVVQITGREIASDCIGVLLAAATILCSRDCLAARRLMPS